MGAKDQGRRVHQRPRDWGGFIQVPTFERLSKPERREERLPNGLQSDPKAWIKQTLPPERPAASKPFSRVSPSARSKSRWFPRRDTFPHKPRDRFLVDE